MFDSFGRNVHYIRVSVTDRCNLRCTYCMPEEGVPFVPHDRIMSLERIALVIRAAASLGFDKVRLTGGEPLVRKGIEDLVSMLTVIPGISTLSMTTNGTLLAPVAADLKRRGLSSVNVSLDTLDPERYAAITRGGILADAVDGIRAALLAGLPVKLNVVVNELQQGQSTESADLVAVRDFAKTEGCAVQTIRQYRLDEDKYDDERYERPSPCALCDRIRLLATGELKPCLHGDATVRVDWSNIKEGIQACVNMKPACGSHASAHLVSAIGG